MADPKLKLSMNYIFYTSLKHHILSHINFMYPTLNEKEQCQILIKEFSSAKIIIRILKWASQPQEKKNNTTR